MDKMGGAGGRDRVGAGRPALCHLESAHGHVALAPSHAPEGSVSVQVTCLGSVNSFPSR